MRACCVELTITGGRVGGLAGRGAECAGGLAVTALTGADAGLGEGRRPWGTANPPTSLVCCCFAATGCRPAPGRSVALAAAPTTATTARPPIAARRRFCPRQAANTRMGDGGV